MKSINIYAVRRVSVTIALATMLAGCTVGPDYNRDEIELDLIENYQNARENADNGTMANWWEQLNDPLIAQYVNQLLSNNLDLKAASARIAQAEARLGIQRRETLPVIGLSGSGSRNFSPTNALNIPGNDGPSTRLYTTNYALNLNASWELDLFGRIARSTEVATANLFASTNDAEALKHSLIAQLVNRRISIGVNQQLLSLAQKSQTNREQIYSLVKRRYDLGTRNTTLNDVLLANENLTTVSADVHRFQRILQSEYYALDTLLGDAPGTSQLTSLSFTHLTAPDDAPLCVPAKLLDRRPDLRASELRLASSNAELGIAIADLYPQFSISGSIGFSGNSGQNLFSARQLTGSIISAISNRLFEGGAIRANIALQNAETNELIHQYALQILNAINEVEDALQSEQALKEEVVMLKASSESLQRAETLSQSRYQDGLVSFIDFLDTQNRGYQIQQTLIAREQELWSTRVALYLALGGDWFNEQNDRETCK